MQLKINLDTLNNERKNFTYNFVYQKDTNPRKMLLILFKYLKTQIEN